MKDIISMMAFSVGPLGSRWFLFKTVRSNQYPRNNKTIWINQPVQTGTLARSFAPPVMHMLDASTWITWHERHNDTNDTNVMITMNYMILYIDIYINIYIYKNIVPTEERRPQTSFSMTPLMQYLSSWQTPWRKVNVNLSGNTDWLFLPEFLSENAWNSNLHKKTLMAIIYF